MARVAVLTPDERIANKRANRLRYMQAYKAVAYVDPHDAFQVAPPRYVLKEREIRRQIPPASFTAKMFGDPLPGYSGKDNMRRRISVQDALEICALYNGKPAEIIALARSYKVSEATIYSVVRGEWFDRLLPRKDNP